MSKRLVLLPLLLAAAAPALAAPRGEAKLQIQGKNVTIDYGRPSLGGRDMLGKADVGQTWRMGADAPTTLTTEADLTIGSASVPKGSYVLTATRKAKEEWTLNVEERGTAPGDAGKKVAEVPLTLATLPASEEQLTINLTPNKYGGVFELKWGTAALRANIKAAK